MPVKSYQDDLLKRLCNREYAAEYLKISFEETMKDGDKEAFLLAVKNVVQANQSMTIVQNEHETDNSQEQVSPLLEINHPLTIETLGFILQRVGLTLNFQPAINHES